MRIFIAITTYNGAKYLREQLDSFLYQTRQPAELVVCDDRSTDSTLESALGQSSTFFVAGCGTVIRKAWLYLALPIPADVCADDSWLHRLALSFGVRALYDQPLQYYRRHGNNSPDGLASNPVRMTEQNALRARFERRDKRLVQ